jgi:hypothetical protein
LFSFVVAGGFTNLVFKRKAAGWWEWIKREGLQWLK